MIKVAVKTQGGWNYEKAPGCFDGNGFCRGPAGRPGPGCPSVLGTWKGSAPKITSAAVCSTTAVTLSVTKQCGNLFAGKATITGSTVAIPFVGRLIYDAKTATYSVVVNGLYINTSTYLIVQFALTGTYSATTPPKVIVPEFDFFNYYSNTMTTTTSVWDNFNLIKQ